MLYCCFKQKTAYEMRISDWSTDVCSSDLSILSVARVGFSEIEIKDGLACICTNACRGIGQHGFHAERGNASGQCIAENATGFRLTGNSGINPDHAGWAVRQQVNTGVMRRHRIWRIVDERLLVRLI